MRSASPSGLPSGLPGYLPGLDVVRAFAAAMVVVCHAVRASTVWYQPWNVAHPGWGLRLDRAMSLFGAWGVGLFFVLSGVCIHLPMARRLARGEPAILSTGSYFVRRFRRIYPPHLATLVASAAVALLLARPIALFSVHPMISFPNAKQAITHLLLIHTFFPSAVSSWNHVLWSIAVEAHFYVLYPLLLLLRRRTHMGKLLLGLVALSVLLRLGLHGCSDETKAILTSSFLGRFWEWVLGCIVAERLATGLVVPQVRVLLFVGLLAVSMALGAAAVQLPYGSFWCAMIWPPIFAGLIWLSTRLQVLPGGALAALGRRSYSLYLTHPIALTLGLVLARQLGLPYWAEWIIALPMVAIVMLVFFRFVEERLLVKPALRPVPPIPEPA